MCLIVSMCCVSVVVLLLVCMGIVFCVMIVLLLSLGIMKCMFVLCSVILVLSVCWCVWMFLKFGSSDGWMFSSWFLYCLMNVGVRMCMKLVRMMRLGEKWLILVVSVVLKLLWLLNDWWLIIVVVILCDVVKVSLVVLGWLVIMVVILVG